MSLLTWNYDIAVWSNQGCTVAFPSGKFTYPGEKAVRDDHVLREYIYYTGDDSNYKIIKDLPVSRGEKGKKDGAFIIKEGKNWTLKGKIVSYELVDDDDDRRKIKIIVEGTPEILGSNKRDALTKLLHIKQKGKGTGTLMRGVCRICRT